MKTDKRYFKVKFGYSVADQVSIEETELEKAIYSQLKGVPTQLGNSFVNGRNIIAITPHYHKHTGWNDYYEPKDGEDWRQIKRDCPDYEGVIENYKERVKFLINNGMENQIGQGVEIPQLNKPQIEIVEGVKELSDKFKIDEDETETDRRKS